MLDCDFHDMVRKRSKSMNQTEARSIIRAKLEGYRARTYAELEALIGEEPETGRVVGESGEEYQFEIQAFWDSRPRGSIRVVAAIDECPHKSIFWRVPILKWIPLYATTISEDFILSPGA